jgi:hypothetical protein
MEETKKLRAQFETNLYYLNRSQYIESNEVRKLTQELKNIIELENTLRAYKAAASESSESISEPQDETLGCWEFVELNDRDSGLGRITFIKWEMPCEKWKVQVYFPNNDETSDRDKGCVQLLYEVDADGQGDDAGAYDKPHITIPPVLTYVIGALHDGFRKYDKDKCEVLSIYNRLAPLLARAVNRHLPKDIQNDADWKRACRDYVSEAPENKEGERL